MRKSPSLIDQIRAAVLAADESRYKISKATGISQGNLCNFVHGKTGLSLANIDRLCAHLKLRLTRED
jgi:DNA-binding Xre family transcriptional regulator